MARLERAQSSEQQFAQLTRDFQELRDEWEKAFEYADETSPEIWENLFERWGERIERMQETTQDLYERYAVSEKRLRAVLTADKSIWMRPTELPLAKIPRFVPIEARPTAPGGGKTRLISLINLKGGVGKTTLTANLVAAFASGNYRDLDGRSGRSARVLAVDLDFQGTLSQRCAAPLQFENAMKNLLTSTRLLKLSQNPTFEFDDLTIPFVGATTAELIPANERLDDFDVLRLNELSSRLRETRFYFRFWFHREEVFKNYDYVFFDCPPRLTASSVCALVASDFAFIPTAPETFDVNAVLRTLIWIGESCKNLKLAVRFGGAILNRTNNEKDLTTNELQNKAKIKMYCEDFYSVFPHFSERANFPPVLDAFIPRRSGSNHINGGDGAALSGATSPHLHRLATEIYRRIQ